MPELIEEDWKWDPRDVNGTVDDCFCEYGHTKSSCLCHRVLCRLGHDECIFKANAQTTRIYKFDGAGGMRKKGEGAGWMCSAFVDSIRGFGMPMTKLELAEFNVFLRRKYGEQVIKE